jgi:hypothetical protein
MAYWKTSQTGGAFSDKSWVYAGAGRTPNSNGFKGVTQTGSSGKFDSTLTLSQTDIFIPAGAMVDVSAWIKPLRSGSSNSKPFSITLTLDGQEVSTFTTTGTSGRSMTNRIAVKSGMNLHTLALLVRTKGEDGKDIFAADDFAIKVVSGPNGQKLCT